MRSSTGDKAWLDQKLAGCDFASDMSAEPGIRTTRWSTLYLQGSLRLAQSRSKNSTACPCLYLCYFHPPPLLTETSPVILFCLQLEARNYITAQKSSKNGQKFES